MKLNIESYSCELKSNIKNQIDLKVDALKIELDKLRDDMLKDVDKVFSERLQYKFYFFSI